METTGIEPATSALRTLRSPSRANGPRFLLLYQCTTFPQGQKPWGQNEENIKTCDDNQKKLENSNKNEQEEANKNKDIMEQSNKEKDSLTQNLNELQKQIDELKGESS